MNDKLRELLKSAKQTNNETVIDYRGFTIHIIQDEGPINPRVDFDNLGTMICFHKHYDLGDKHGYRFENYSGWDELLETIRKDNGPIIYLPLYLYDHSGITMSTSPFSCPWDSMQVGFIYIPKAKACKDYSWKCITRAREEKIRGCLRSEVETYDTYLRGEIYGYDVKDSKGESVDSCWGFFGDFIESGLLDQALSAAGHAADKLSIQDKYLQNPTQCPYCQSSDILGGSIEIENGKASQRITCQACGKAWHGVYTLTGIVEGE